MKKYLFALSIILVVFYVKIESFFTIKKPVIIVNENRNYNIPEFWIDKIQNSNNIIMNENEIDIFNNNIAYNQNKLTFFKDINKTYQSSVLIEEILGGYTRLSKTTTHFKNGRKIPNNFYQKIKKELNLNVLKTKIVKTRFALTTAFSNQKTIPTNAVLLKKKGQIHFDRNQNSALDLATGVAVLHSSKDAQWYYVIGPTSSGWVHKENIAFAKKEVILNYLNAKNFIVTTATKTALNIKGKYYDYMRMGVRLPLVLKSDKKTIVLVPSSDNKGNLLLTEGAVKSIHINEGYLRYTAENILIQAFKFLHSPYGWGGMYGEQDCSKFIQEIYATVGIKLPRNSSSQSTATKDKIELSGISKKSKHNFLKNRAIVGASILHLKGHIVLYLGEEKGKSYIIHTVWGGSSTHFALARTAITSLDYNAYLGKIDRVTNLVID